jgi:hypothetical protein
MVELPAPGAAIGLGLKLAVVPSGSPEVNRVIVLLKPPLIVVVIVEVPWLPSPTMSDTGEAETLKFAVPVTVKKATTVCWMPAPEPVTVMG